MASNSYYIFGHQNYRLESQRLTHQHYLCTDLFDGLLRPEIQADLASRAPGDTIWIADVGCGNGIWAHNIAASPMFQGRNVQVTGFDITSKLCPPMDERPANVAYMPLDMFKEPPDIFHGNYDVVNVRLVQTAIMYNDPRLAIANIVKLLSPGGWLQWFEYDLDSPIAAPGSAFLRIPEMIPLTRAGHSAQWVKEMDHLFREAGLVDAHQLDRVPKPGMMRYWKDNFYLGVLSIVSELKNEKVNQLWELCEKERMEKGFNVMFRSSIATGRKAGRRLMVRLDKAQIPGYWP